MVSCQLVEREMCSCLLEKEKNKWKLAGRGLLSERKVRCRVGFHFFTIVDCQRKEAILGDRGRRKYFLKTVKDLIHSKIIEKAF